jgi:hypothetical protein
VRTTLDIEKTVLKELREIQRREGGTLGAIASRLMAEAMARKPRRAAATFSWTSQPMEAIVDLEDKDLVYTILDRPSRAAEP